MEDHLMEHHLGENHEMKFAFSDFLDLLRRHKKALFLAMLAGATACFLLAITRPVVYLVKATFRDKGKTQAAIRSSLTDLLFSSASSQDSEAASTMKSRLLISEVIRELNAQGIVGKAGGNFPRLEMEVANAEDSLLAEWAYWMEYHTPILEDESSPLALADIEYDGEVAKGYSLYFRDENHFTLERGENLPSIEGELNQPIQLPNGHFTVGKGTRSTPLQGERYVLLLLPMKDIAEIYGGMLIIDVDKEDKTLLKLQFRHRNRQFAAQFLNSLMRTYQRHLLDEHEFTSNTQVSYLERRQKEVGQELEKLMDAHVNKVSDDMAHSGFTSLQKEMDFLAAHLAANQQKLTELTFETKRLENIDPNECVHYDSYTGRGDSAIINQLLAEMRALKQESDALELALQTSQEISPLETQAGLEANFQALESTRERSYEVELLSEALRKGREKGISLRLLNAPTCPVSAWYDTYKTKEKAWILASFNAKVALQEDFEQFREHFLTYLDTFKRVLKIQEVTLEQRMRTQQNPDEEFEGLSLEAAKSLSLSYVKELNEIQAGEKQHRFIVEQLKSPDFEISSLTALLHDPISHDRIGKATQLMINLKDENNRTQKEIERLKTELELQKSFLASHTHQMADLLHEKQTLLKGKITSLRIVALDLAHQRISLLKKHLGDYLENRLGNLEQEKKLLLDHQVALHARMTEIPSKWAQEQLLNQNMVMQQRFLENLSNMVESKNITKNLEMIQSAPLDLAIPPLNPKPPRLLFFTLFGSILGFLGTSSFLFTRVMVKGVPASIENLRLANFHTSGFITPFHGDEWSATTPLIDTDLDALRRLIAHFEEGSSFQVGTAKQLLIISGKGPDFSNTLAKLLSKKGQRALRLELGFKKAATENAPPALLQYLEGKVESPHIEKLDGFDRIAAGGASRYSEELLRSPRFFELLKRLKTSYDWTLALAPIKVASAEAENLAKLFDGTIVVVTDETLQELLAFSESLDRERKKSLTFLMAPRNST